MVFRAEKAIGNARSESFAGIARNASPVPPETQKENKMDGKIKGYPSHFFYFFSGKQIKNTNYAVFFPSVTLF